MRSTDRRGRRASRLLLAAAVLWLLGSAPALAHPLGDRSVNRAVALVVSGARLQVHVVVDLAETPTFALQDRLEADPDAVADNLIEQALAGLLVEVADRPVPLDVSDWRLALVPGQLGLQTLRLDVRFEAALASEATLAVTVADRADIDAAGWREMSARATDGATIVSTTLPASSPTHALTAYPSAAAGEWPDVRSGAVTVVTASGDGMTVALPPLPEGAFAAAVSGIALPTWFPIDLGGGGLIAALLALLGAAAVGVGHAVGPGHGKTLLAAWLLGTDARRRDAWTLGGVVAGMHTVSVLVVGGVLIVLTAQVPSQTLDPWLRGLGGAALVVVAARLLLARHDHHHDHDHGHGHGHRSASTSPTSTAGLAALALAGGMLPSPTAMLLLLAAAAVGRPVLAVGLVAAFGIGMAMALGGLGTALVAGRDVVARRLGLERLAWLPRASAAALGLLGVALLASVVGA